MVKQTRGSNSMQRLPFLRLRLDGQMVLFKTKIWGHLVKPRPKVASVGAITTERGAILQKLGLQRRGSAAGNTVQTRERVYMFYILYYCLISSQCLTLAQARYQPVGKEACDMQFAEFPVYRAENKRNQQVDLRANKQIGLSQANRRLRVGKKELISFQMI